MSKEEFLGSLNRLLKSLGKSEEKNRSPITMRSLTIIWRTDIRRSKR